MTYKVKNISETVFSFEGVVIEPGQVSKELNLDMYQKVLALNYGTMLMPVEEEEVEATAGLAGSIEPPAEVVSTTETVVSPEVPVAAVAAEPQVEAPKRRGRPRKNL